MSKFTIETKYGTKWGRKGCYWVISDIGRSVRAESFGTFTTKEQALLDAKIVIGAVARDQLSMWVHVLLAFCSGLAFGIAMMWGMQ